MKNSFTQDGLEDEEINDEQISNGRRLNDN